MMKTKERTKDVPICNETPICREPEATELQSRGKYLGQDTEETEIINTYHNKTAYYFTHNHNPTWLNL